jgi:hypothetical protein
MQCIHLIHPWKYDTNADQFITDAFANREGSLSIIGIECAGAGTICAYVERFCPWPSITSKPPVFWRFDTDHLPAEGRLVESGGDDHPCHFDVFDLDDGQLFGVIENVDITDLEICHNGTPKHVSREEFFKIKAEYDAKLLAKKNKKGKA